VDVEGQGTRRVGVRIRGRAAQLWRAQRASIVSGFAGTPGCARHHPRVARLSRTLRGARLPADNIFSCRYAIVQPRIIVGTAVTYRHAFADGQAPLRAARTRHSGVV
jgi:hypothetical protein